ncbi:hypothetical protein BDR06DRAFT_399752 [Suillus hirtellus]|nr:hypothetical protein BDR06DRAFT_399752 [Suillus hirtellus]
MMHAPPIIVRELILRHRHDFRYQVPKVANRAMSALMRHALSDMNYWLAVGSGAEACSIYRVLLERRYVLISSHSWPGLLLSLSIFMFTEWSSVRDSRGRWILHGSGLGMRLKSTFMINFASTSSHI